MNADDLKVVLEKHSLWLKGDVNGVRANLHGANLHGANLYGANLRGADMRGADMRGANLYGAYMCGANLYGADMRGAYMRSANLYGANLYGADMRGADMRGADMRGAYMRSANLYGANLHGADMRGADMRGANLYGAYMRGVDMRGVDMRGVDMRGVKGAELVIARTRILPEGTLIGWKKCQNNILVKLRIPEDAKRSHAFGRKCRAEFADVLEIIGAHEAVSTHDESFIYRVGERVKTTNGWSEEWQAECAPGIHFFITREEAEAY